MRNSLLYKRRSSIVSLPFSSHELSIEFEREKMAFGVRLCLFLLLVFAAISSARNTISFSDNEMASAMKWRSLKMTLSDYGDPTANSGHDPSQKNKNWGGRKG
ncbi:hypothetical protein SADUNF_Sadunf09G0057200 [Salix dunnii]|uniref:Uncharacterized protein n=1 Tax=Salix dunnii TaxID=1413687 RepID=A0A835JQS3_9ROSI|nr:hypothetical protein SADUNF_Sadunf09G0057200 [Salix dunnii]